MIKINGKTTMAVQRIGEHGKDRITISMEDDLRKAVEAFEAVDVIEAESLAGQDIYRATGEGPAQIQSINRVPANGTLMVILQGIAKEA